VDDNADLAQSTAWLLEVYGHAVRIAPSGRDALAAVATEPPDVALVDIRMPGMDGHELTRRLRVACGGGLFVVVVSGMAAAADVRRSHAAGANLHLAKPVDPAVIADLLHAFQLGAVAVRQTARDGVGKTTGRVHEASPNYTA
jgi:CheY-like chemotaxis protein